MTDSKLAATLRQCIEMDCGNCPIKRVAPADGYADGADEKPNWKVWYAACAGELAAE